MCAIVVTVPRYKAYIDSFNGTLRKKCLGWTTYRVAERPALQNEVHALLARYHYRRPLLGLSPMQPPLAPHRFAKDGLSDIYGE
ncbi:MAG: hypothetical protein OEV01_07260 [Nitrospira sp.]|nr:hypothetical protein [Nitrospira sp.]MDH4304763.1 hypothetical protein [Nitrospira sp.]MDH5192483.1 hypothetical protein [Nitrospira sp.]